ncbi:Group 10 secretory phospholipase A2 [Galemys pyrenaicus]|uniref:Phospholipase A2 n=1 Tax=Galemys pyrenaicus TaxID=202257 RepID=A0A8J6A0Y2_GALPY|nr:Group 10 secretory phospholipase A2 [Galemys pyrenaicus]
MGPRSRSPPIMLQLFPPPTLLLLLLLLLPGPGSSADHTQPSWGPGPVPLPLGPEVVLPRGQQALEEPGRCRSPTWNGTSPGPTLGLVPSVTVRFWASRRSHVHRRGLLELAGTMECAGTHSPLAYVTYGCYCGLGGSGQPRDTVDWCCHRHDCCYARAEETGCSPKMEPYSWQCVNGTILCGPAENRCQELLCRCDQEIAYCLAENEYNIKHLFFPRFLCGANSPKCD